ncbi:MAG: ATP-binding cassette domain-containing protein, partial [Bacilli bacterium]|nr:ATP-binding cassette domain-containing protein [Bacilli bacterium]MDD4718987.1 ATP-binding cassette domain-containing protein [Bacilli bacterium]
CEIKGEIKLPNRLGYLEQMLNENWNNLTVRDFFLRSNFDEEIDYSIYNDYNKLYDVFKNLNLDTDIIESTQKIKTLSGGEKVKIQLAKILLNIPDLLLLDEPTNDLDIDTLKWLENFIINTNIPILYVSHDELLLENTSNMIIHLEQINKKTDVRNIVIKENYKTYVSKREQFIKKHNQMAVSQQKEFKQKKEVLKTIKQEVEKQNPERQNRMRHVLAQEKKLDEIELKENYDVEESINLFFSDNIKNLYNKIIIDYQKNLDLLNGKIINNVKLKLIGSTHITIIGKNGIGKTTLIEDIYNELKNRQDIKVGYMPQNYNQLFDNYQTPIDFLSNKVDDKTKIMTMMGTLNFTYEEMISDIKELSGGTKAKLLLIGLVLDQSNVLILDEPTRNLSPLSNPVIRNILVNFKGAIIAVSHDRKYITEVSDKVLELSEKGLIETVI